MSWSSSSWTGSAPSKPCRSSTSCAHACHEAARLNIDIRQLPQPVADAIAAGEVVERPASVVKELVENALDAGARRVSLDIAGAGRSLIRVADDGHGIPPGQLGLALVRHATSKVHEIADLGRIRTLGFRGEALASIAAVSDMEISSRGSRRRVRGAEVLEEGAAPAGTGTIIEVRDLFALTPARLRFLKTDSTENSALLRVAQSYALLYPEVRFEVRLDGRRSFATPGDGDAARAAAAILGAVTAASLRPIEDAGGAVTVRGLVSPAQLSRGSRDGILLAVNRRPIASRALGFALEECYRGLLERGRFPVAVLDLGVDPEAVDVNVHPAKREVRFRDEGAVYAALQRAVRGATGTPSVFRVVTPEAAGAGQSWLREAGATAAPPPAGAGAAVERLTVLRPVGQVLDGYLVAEGPEGLVLVDQHAAHERILFNAVLERLRRGAVISQPLLLAETLELTPAQAAALPGLRQRLDRLGFELDDFGPRTARLRAAPPELDAGRAAAALLEMLDGPAEARGAGQHALAASIACHAAVRFGDSMEPEEQRRLLRDLEAAPDSMTCPHGRPTRLVLDWQELKRRFRRNY